MPESPDKETIQNLLRIGEFKNGLAMNQRGWCNDLGLFVQFHEGQMLEAEGKFRKKIRLVGLRYRLGNQPAWRVPTA